MTRTRPSRLTMGVAIGALSFAVAGCSSGAGASASSASSSPPSSPDSSPSSSSVASTSASAPAPAPALPAGAKTLAVTISGRRISPPPNNVELKAGQTLRLTVTDDHDNVLHAHGFDKEVDLVAGKPTTVDLVTGLPGAYEVETHHPELKLLTVLVR